jgi:hypothetical protein
LYLKSRLRNPDQHVTDRDCHPPELVGRSVDDAFAALVLPGFDPDFCTCNHSYFLELPIEIAFRASEPGEGEVLELPVAEGFTQLLVHDRTPPSVLPTASVRALVAVPGLALASTFL